MDLVFKIELESLPNDSLTEKKGAKMSQMNPDGK